MSEKLRDLFKGARRSEIFILIVIVALAGMIFFGGNGQRPDTAETDLEVRLRDLLTYIDGVEAPEVMISHGPEGEIVGVVVIARGVGDMRALLRVQNAVRTLLDVELSQIEIIERK